MKNIKLNKQQSRAIAHTVYGDIKEYCDVHLERFLMFYLDELKKANGQPIAPITIKFYPCFPYDITNSATDVVEKESE